MALSASTSAAWSRSRWAATSASVTVSPAARSAAWISASRAAHSRSRAAICSPASPVLRQLGLERPEARLDRLAGRRDRRAEALCEGRGELVGPPAGAQPLDACELRAALLCELLGLPPLGRQLALELGLAHGQRSLAGLGAARSSSSPRRSCASAASAAARSAARSVSSAPARASSASRTAARALSTTPRASCSACATRSTSAISRSRSLRRARTQLGAALGELANLAPGAEPDAPGARHGDAAEVLRQVLEALDHPRVGEQARGQREHGRRPAHELEQSPVPRARAAMRL